MNLTELKQGERGKILKITGDKMLKQRLMTMGFTQNETVKVDKFAPLGDPVEYVIKNYHISLRKSEAKFIEVEKVEL
ncbi:MAG: FeoA family protein [Candidatus Muiribacteriota bacterium]|jgi:ferrous iron transport protein A